MSKGLKLSPLVLAAMVAMVLLGYLYMPQETQQKQRKTTGAAVILHTAQMQDFVVVIEALGTAKANESVSLTAQKTDIVQNIQFTDGQKVAKNQLLLTLNDAEEKARLNVLDINLQEAKRQLKRLTDLARESATSEQLLDEQQAKVKAVQAQIEVVQAQLSELQVRAPFSGLLGIRQVSVGSLIRPGDVITTLDDMTVIKVDFTISESHLPSVSHGLTVTATSVAYPDEVFEGKISSINSRIDPITRAIQIRATIDNQSLKLRPGMLLQINLQQKSINTLVVPEAAILPIEDKQYVFTVKDNKSTRKEVVVGKRKIGIVQILSGIEAGEKVVIEGTLRLRDGASVKVLNTPSSEE
jgi:membrane fusion protein (multidrug efflux system)